MQSESHRRRWLAAGITAVVLLTVVALRFWFGRVPNGEDQANAAAQKKKARAHTWPLFGGSLNRNMVNTFEKDVPSEWSVEEGQEKNIKWAAKLGSRSYAGPVIANGRIFVGTNRAAPRTPNIKGNPDKGVLMCLDEKTGKLIWQQINDKLAAGLVNDWPDQGICSTPVVDDKRVYYVSNRCEVLCVDWEPLSKGKNRGVKSETYKDSKEGTDADIIWRLDMMRELGVFPHNLATSSPLIVGDLLFVVTSNGVDEGHINVPAPRAPSFIALNKKTGKLVWKNNDPSANILKGLDKANKEAFMQRLADRGQKILHGQWSNPVYAVINGKPQIIYPGGDGWLRAFEPDPEKDEWKMVWKFDCNPKRSIWKLQGKGTRNNIVATPVVHDSKIFVGVGQDPEHKYGVGHLWCVDITKKGDLSEELVVDYGAKVTRANPTGVNTKKNPRTGVIWHHGGMAPEGAERAVVFGRTISTVAVHDGLVYAAELEGYLHCLDAKTGKQYWEHNLESETWGSPYWVDGKVYIGNDEGQMFIFKHGKKKEEPKVIEMSTRIRSTPVALNGVLYLMTENHLFAIKK